MTCSKRDVLVLGYIALFEIALIRFVYRFIRSEVKYIISRFIRLYKPLFALSEIRPI